MRAKNRFGICFALALACLAPQKAIARISILSLWDLHDRLPTPLRQLDQSAGFDFGLNGVTPSGADTDAKFFGIPYQAAYGVLEQLEVGAGWGLAWVDRRGRSSQFGISDLSVAARYRFFDANRAERMPGLDAEFGLTFPTASFDKGLGTGALGLLFGWGLVLPIDPARAHLGLGFKLNTENSDDVRVGGVFSYDAGFTYPLKGMKQPFDLTLELKGFNHARNKVSGAKTGPAPDELYLAPGALWKFHPKAELSSLLLIGLTTDSSDLGLHLALRF